MAKKSKTKLKKSEGKKRGRSKATVKQDKGKSSAVATTVHAPHGSVAVIPAVAEARFVIRKWERKDENGPRLVLVDTMERKNICMFYDTPGICEFNAPLIALLHDVIGNAPSNNFTAAQGTAYTNILRAIEYNAVAFISRPRRTS